MAIVGGGPGGGGPIGSANSFTGTAESIQLIGEHFYIYSPGVGIDNNEGTLIETKTGNYYCYAKMATDV